MAHIAIGIAKIRANRNDSESLKAIYLAVQALGQFLLAGRLADENVILFEIFKILQWTNFAAFGFFE